MSLFSRQKMENPWLKARVITERIKAGLEIFENQRGYLPAAIILDYNWFWRILHDDNILHRPGHVVEFYGVRLLPCPDLEEQIYLVEHLYEVPDVIFLGEG